MKQKKLIFIFLAALMALPVFAERVEMRSLAMPTVASNGFGGHHTAYTDNVFSLLVNPAAVARTRQKSFFTLSLSLSSPETLLGLYDPIMGIVNGEDGAIKNMMQNLEDKNGKIGLGTELREFPFSFAYVADGFGFGLWNRAYVDANIRDDKVDATGFVDLMLPIGFAFKIINNENHSLDVGATVKPFARVMTSENKKIIDLAGDTDDFVNNLNAPLIVGGGIDAGIMYRWTSVGLQAGFTFNDIYSRGEVVHSNVIEVFDKNANAVKNTNSYYFPFTMNAGLAWHIDLAFLGLTVAGDWHNVANAFQQNDYLNRNWLLDLSAGVEASLFKIFYVRAGVNEMLPAVGAGVSLGGFKIDVAYYGKEMGLEPGQLPVPVLEASISVRPDVKKK